MVVPKDGDAAKAEAELLKLAEGIAAAPITAAELADARQRIANGYELAFNNVNAVGMSLSEYVAAGDWRLWYRAARRHRQGRRRRRQPRRQHKAYLIPSNRTLARFITDNAVRADIGDAPTVASLVDGYKGRAALEAGEAFDPTPANLAARTQTYTIGDKLMVSLLPSSDPRKQNAPWCSTPIVSATSTRCAAFALAAAGMAGSLLMRGSKTMTREQDRQALRGTRRPAPASAAAARVPAFPWSSRRGELRR